MTEVDGTLLTVLIGICLAFLLVILTLVIRISSRIERLENRTSQGVASPEAAIENSPDSETSAGGAFEIFLSEDPARRELSKAEQFSAYRKWRQQNGMNWSNS